jgi:hypothetical protein
MGRNPLSGEDLTSMQNTDTPSAPTTDSGAWHRPVVTIIDLKRTMFGLGAYFDGLNTSTS